MPEVCVSRWRIVIGRAGGRDSNVRSASSNDVITRTPENSGSYLVTGSPTACSIAHAASAAAAAAHVLSFGMRAILAIIVRHAPLRRVVPRALSRDRHHPVDAGVHPPARVLLELHPARELSRHRHRLPAGL